MPTFDYLAPTYEQNLDFPMLVSFPRTGSHWFRMIMELYLNIPCLVTSFFIDRPTTFWGIHRHDIKTTIKNRNKVIYLYRNPVDTIYSEMVYNQKPFKEYIDDYINLYATQVKRWLYNASDIKDIEYITYEQMKKDPIEEVKRILTFLNFPIDEDKLNSCCKEIDKNKVKERTQHDPKVICRSNDYDKCRELFKVEYSDYILKKFEQKDSRLVW